MTADSSTDVTIGCYCRQMGADVDEVMAATSRLAEAQSMRQATSLQALPFVHWALLYIIAVRQGLAEAHVCCHQGPSTAWLHAESGLSPAPRAWLPCLASTLFLLCIPLPVIRVCSMSWCSGRSCCHELAGDIKALSRTSHLVPFCLVPSTRCSGHAAAM